MDTVTPRPSRPRRSFAVVLVVVLAALLPSVAVQAATDRYRGEQWGLDVIDADDAWARSRGAGQVIAVLDTGVDLGHPDLVDRLVPGRDFVEDDDVPQDRHGHGTHVAGIAAATAENGRGIAGVAPEARIMPVRVLGADGSGSAADVEAGIDWAVANGADVINLSLSGQAQAVFGPSFSEAVERAWAAGVVVVVAAGNEFVLSSGFGEEPALVVSATTMDDQKPDYSNGVGDARWGIAAPGGGCGLLTCPSDTGVLSTYWTGTTTESYARLSGTSMAAPHVAGAAAVLLSLGLTPQETVDRLLRTATDLGSSGEDSTFGHGRLDLAAATAGLSPQPDPEPEPTSPAPTSAPSPAATSTGTTGPPPSSPSPSSTTDDAPSSVASPAAPPTGAAPAPSNGASAAPPDQPTPTASPAGPDDASAQDEALAAAGPAANEDGGDGTAPGWLVWLTLLLLLATGATVTSEALRRAS